MLQQKERDNARLFFLQRNYPFLFALTRKQPTANSQQPSAVVKENFVLN